MKKTVLVIGATGMLGAPVARRLAKDGYRVRVLARDPAAARSKLGSDFDYALGDVGEPDSVARALEGCGAVHVNLMGGPRPEDFDRVEHLGTATVARAAAKAGVSRLTYLSGAPVGSDDNLTDAGTRSKRAAEAAIVASGVPYTIFRATWMMEALELFVRGRSALVLGRQPHPLRWIAADDYAAMVSKSLEVPSAEGRILFAVGPEPLTKAAALETYCRIVRPDVRVRHLPLWLMSTVAALSFDPNLRADVRRMRFYDGIGDDFGDPTECEDLFGAAPTTLEAWCRTRVTSLG